LKPWTFVQGVEEKLSLGRAMVERIARIEDSPSAQERHHQTVKAAARKRESVLSFDTHLSPTWMAILSVLTLPILGAIVPVHCQFAVELRDVFDNEAQDFIRHTQDAILGDRGELYERFINVMSFPAMTFGPFQAEQGCAAAVYRLQ